MIIQTPPKQAEFSRSASRSCRTCSSKPETDTGFCDSLGNTTTKGPSLPQAGVLSYSLSGRSLLALIRGIPLPAPELQAQGTPCRIWALCWCPSQGSFGDHVGSVPIMWTPSGATRRTERSAPGHLLTLALGPCVLKLPNCAI